MFITALAIATTMLHSSPSCSITLVFSVVIITIVFSVIIIIIPILLLLIRLIVLPSDASLDHPRPLRLGFRSNVDTVMWLAYQPL